MLSKLIHLQAAVSKVALAVAVSIAIALVVYETVIRFLAPSLLTDWGAEVTVYLMGWALMLTLPKLVFTGEHVHADLVLHRLSPAVQRWLEGMASLVGIGFCSVILYAGIEVVQFAHMLGEESDSSLQFPMWLFYLAVPVGFGLSALAYILNLIKVIKYPHGDAQGESS